MKNIYCCLELPSKMKSLVALQVIFVLIGICLGASIDNEESSNKAINRELVDIWLYTRDSSQPEKIDSEFLNLDDTHFLKSRAKTFVLIHGWNSNIGFAEKFEGGELRSMNTSMNVPITTYNLIQRMS